MTRRRFFPSLRPDHCAKTPKTPNLASLGLRQVLPTYISCSKSPTSHWFRGSERDHGHSETLGSWWINQSPNSLSPGPHWHPSPEWSSSACSGRTNSPGIALLSGPEKLRNCLWMLARGETALTLKRIQTFKSPSFIPHLPLSLLTQTRGPMGEGAGFSAQRRGPPPTWWAVSTFHSTHGVISHSVGKLGVNLLCKTYSRVYLTDCRVIFEEDCLLGIFRICRQKQRLCWTPKTLWHDNTWRFLNSQLFSLRAICSAFLIIPACLAPCQLCLGQYAS